ncbi:MAG: peroxiredoxin-like family protein [Telluria sp.]
MKRTTRPCSFTTASLFARVSSSTESDDSDGTQDNRKTNFYGKYMLLPRQLVPELRVPTLAHGEFDLAGDAPEHFTLVVFYRGLHCPVCLKYLRELGTLLPEYERRGTKIIAISSDVHERAQEMARKVGVDNLRIGHSLPLPMARRWGLYISSSRGKSSINIEEPSLFSEPGVFLVRPDGSLYYGAVQTMPFARPLFAELLQAIDFAITRNYPARGEYDGLL